MPFDTRKISPLGGATQLSQKTGAPALCCCELDCCDELAETYNDVLNDNSGGFSEIYTADETFDFNEETASGFQSQGGAQYVTTCLIARQYLNYLWNCAASNECDCCIVSATHVGDTFPARGVWVAETWLDDETPLEDPPLTCDDYADATGYDYTECPDPQCPEAA